MTAHWGKGLPALAEIGLGGQITFHRDAPLQSLMPTPPGRHRRHLFGPDARQGTLSLVHFISVVEGTRLLA